MTIEKFFYNMVSVYNGVADNIGFTLPLADFLFTEKHKEEILELRKLDNKDARNSIKKRLPMSTISGTFSPTRRAENLQKHSGLICIDIDGDDNQSISDWENTKWQLAKLPQVGYISLSVSGNGLFLIIPLRFPNYHLQQFMQLQTDFEKMGIEIDKSCKDVSRMRCVSCDETPYINSNAVQYEGFFIDKPAPRRCKGTFNYDETMSRIAHCCKEIESRHIDLTANYESWVSICAALATQGENCRDFFHILSQQNPQYKERETDKKFDNLLKQVSHTNIGKFFNECKKYGI